MLARALLIAALAMPATAQAAERRIDLSSFDKLRVEGPFIVTLTTASSPHARMSGDAETLRQVEAQITGATLVVRRTGDRGAGRTGNMRGPITLTIAAPPLSAITVIGGAQVTAQAMRGPQMSLAVNGAGDVRIDRADGEQLAATLLGSGRLAIGGGRVGKARLTASGPATIMADGLEAGDLLVVLDGPGEVDARARYTATIGNNGLGRVTVAGMPKCRMTGTGGGPVRCGAK
ncbi:DUF2807 domain-containing protein [Sphingomonas sanguinis]|nr:DUF2807 domain-containing protein [Sphingomonas sp. LC-1]